MATRIMSPLELACIKLMECYVEEQIDIMSWCEVEELLKYQKHLENENK
mgnify:CR=1 FL=1